MAHWTDDPRIHALMKRLGKVGATGKPTRSAYAAEQVKRVLAQVEARMAEREKVAAEEAALSSEYESLTLFIKERAKRELELRHEIRRAKRDFLAANPGGDTREVDIAAQQAIDDFEKAQVRAMGQIDDLAKSVTMKRTVIRRIDDRIKHSRRQVDALMAQVKKGGASAA